MRGSIVKRSKGSYSLVIDMGRQIDPATGQQKRKQKWEVFYGTRQQAEVRLQERIRELRPDAKPSPVAQDVMPSITAWGPFTARVAGRAFLTGVDYIVHAATVPHEGECQTACGHTIQAPQIMDTETNVPTCKVCLGTLAQPRRRTVEAISVSLRVTPDELQVLTRALGAIDARTYYADGTMTMNEVRTMLSALRKLRAALATAPAARDDDASSETERD